MARKTSKTPIADPPTDSSSSEQEDEDNEEEEDEENTLTQTPQTQKVFTKPIKETSETKETGSNPLPSSTKRSSTSNQEPKESKRSKKKPGEEGSDSAAAVDLEDVKKKTGEEDEKKQLFQRLFSEDDEIAVLKGLLDYLTQKKVEYPFVNTNAFHDFVKDLIHTDVSKQQLMYKVRRLKKKFENNARRSKQGEDRIFTNPHEQKIFELSKMIWGKQGISGKLGNGNENAKEEDRGEEIKVEMELSKSVGSLFDVKSGVGCLENEILKHGFDVVEGEKREALEEKWRKLQVAELELFVQRKELIIEQAKLMLEVYKSEL